MRVAPRIEPLCGVKAETVSDYVWLGYASDIFIVLHVRECHRKTSSLAEEHGERKSRVRGIPSRIGTKTVQLLFLPLT